MVPSLSTPCQEAFEESPKYPDALSRGLGDSPDDLDALSKGLGDGPEDLEGLSRGLGGALDYVPVLGVGSAAGSTAGGAAGGAAGVAGAAFLGRAAATAAARIPSSSSK